MAATQTTEEVASPANHKLDDIEGGMAMAAMTELSMRFADAHEARWSAGPSLPAIEWGAQIAQPPAAAPPLPAGVEIVSEEPSHIVCRHCGVPGGVLKVRYRGQWESLHAKCAEEFFSRVVH